MNETLRILALDLHDTKILSDLRNDDLFTVTQGKIKTVKPILKPDVIIFNYDLIPGNTLIQKRLLSLQATFKNKPLFIAYKSTWSDGLKNHAEMFRVTDTIADNEDVTALIKEEFLNNEHID